MVVPYTPDVTGSDRRITGRTGPARVISRWTLAGSGGSGRVTNLLTTAAVAAACLLILLTASVGVGLGNRIEHSRWTDPQESSAAGPDGSHEPVITQVTTTRYLGGREVRIVHVAPAGDGSAPRSALPAPPGMEHFPAPGEQWVSPALAELAGHDDVTIGRVLQPADHPSSPPFDGVLARDALSGPDELLAVVGHTAGDPAMSGVALHDLMRPDDHVGPVTITDFEGAAPTANTELVQYRWLALIATVLLVVPSLSLAAAGARLGAVRRARRLALLRLGGVDRWTLVRVTLLDALPPAVAGTTIGTLLHLVVLPLAARVPLTGTRWFVTDLIVDPPIVLAVWTTLVVLTAVSALLPLRRILSDPIAVADHHSPALPGLWRVLVTVAATIAFLGLTEGDDVEVWMVIAALGIMFMTLNVIGPVLMRVVGRLMVRHARTGARLVAGRRLLDDPNGSWRQVAAVTLAAFIAGFMALFSVGSTTVWRGDAHTLSVAVPADTAESAAEVLRGALRDTATSAGSEPRVTVSGDGGALDTVVARDGEVAFLQIRLDPDPRTEEDIRRVVARTLPTSPQATGTDVLGRDDRFGVDFRSATIVILAAASAIAAIGTAITSAAAVIDHRTTNKRLYRAGVPFSILDSSRMTQVMAPALLATVGGAGMGLLAASPVTLGSAQLDPSGGLLLAATILVATTAMRLGVAASRPTLRRTIGI